MKIRTSTQVNAPIDVTFDVFSDITQAQDRIEGITHVELLSEVTQGIGTRWRETRIMFGREATEEMEISAFQPNHSYEVVAESHGARYHTRYTFTKHQGGTRVEMVFTGTPTTLAGKVMSVFSPLFARATRQALEADLDALKVAAEQQSTAVTQATV